MMAAPGRVMIGATLLAAGHGGIARVARMTARALIQAGDGVDLLSFLDKVPISIAGVPARRARASKLMYLLLCHGAALGSTRAIYDSVGTARAHPRIGRLRIPYATWIHGIEVWYDDNPDRRRALLGSELVLVNSQFTLDKYQSRHGALPQARVCWLATEEDEPPIASARFDGPPLVLMVGRIDRDQNYKGHAELIGSWPRIVSAVPAARLVIAGSGSGLSAMRERAARSSAAANIEFLGFVPDEMMPKLWQCAHVFAMPSRNEGFELVYVEAMRYGLPVIASVHDAGSEVNVDGETGYNVDMGRPGDLAERLIDLLRGPDAARKMGMAGQARWRQYFRYSAFADRLRAACRCTSIAPVHA